MRAGHGGIGRDGFPFERPQLKGFVSNVLKLQIGTAGILLGIGDEIAPSVRSDITMVVARDFIPMAQVRTIRSVIS